MPDETRIREVLDRFASSPDTGAVSFALTNLATGWSWCYDSEQTIKPYFIGSVTKLYTTALVMQLRQEGLLSLDSAIAEYIDPEMLAGIHVFRSVDRSEAITPRQLLSHSSGLPNYLEQERWEGGSVMADALHRDRGWTFDQALTVVRLHMSPRFAPGARGRVHYSDMNFVLLGRIIENLTGVSWEEAVIERVIRPLGLDHTWPFGVGDIERYEDVAAVMRGGTAIRIPQTMASVRAPAGLVSSAADGTTFAQAFLSGQLFDREYLAEITGGWRRLGGSLHYGLGLMRYTMPRTLTSPPIEFFGHSGSSGAVLFYAPSLSLCISGTVNRAGDRAGLFKLMGSLALAASGQRPGNFVGRISV